MKKIFTFLPSFLIGLLAMILVPLSVQAQGEDEPIITFHTNMYAKATGNGATPSITLSFGAKETTTLEIDAGAGSEECIVNYANLQTDNQGNVAVKGTVYSTQVDQDGWVKIYGDASKIDYFNASGCEIDQIKFDSKLALKILYLEHNNLKTLDIDKLQGLQFVYLEDNPFSAATPLMINRLPNLLVLEVTQIGHIDPKFTLRNFPKLVSFDAYHTLALKTCDPTACPDLRRLSLDMTSVETLDLSKNSQLQILNVSDSRVKTLDLRRNTKLTELYASHTSGAVNTDVKFDKLDVSRCPELFRLYCGGNNLTELDLSRNPKLYTLACEFNKLKRLDLSANTALYSVNVRYNNMDFVTLPKPGNWFEYYHEQNNLELDDTYAVGSVIDLKNRVVRQGSQTNAKMFRVPKNDPTKVVELDKSVYEYNDGKITLKQPVEDNDEVYIEFYNTVLRDYPIRTENFRVKLASEFGKDDKAFELIAGGASGSQMNLKLGIQGASTANPVKVSVDFGDGNKVQKTITEEIPTAVNVSGTRVGSNVIAVYVPQDKYVTALESDGLPISKIDLSNLRKLRVLTLKNAGLESIDIRYNNKLEKLDLSYNNLRKVDLKGPSGYFYKSLLTDINVSHNQLDSLLFNDLAAVRHLNVGSNNLYSLAAGTADNLLTLDISDNKFSRLLLNHSELIEEVNASSNRLTQIYIPSVAPMKKLDISGNFFTLATMPNDFGLGKGKFLYAPQQKLEISASSPGIDLSEQYITKDGNVTQFVWKNIKNQPLVEGVDYTISKGSTKFLKTNIGRVYCEMSHASYPDFNGTKAFKTTYTTPIPMPTNVLASFTTLNKTDSVELSLASVTPGTSIYFEWNGDGSVYQYSLNTTYTRFRAKSKANAKVRVLVANADDKISVFSVSNVKMADADLSGLKDAKTITLSNTGLSEVKLPADVSKIRELDLSSNNFTSFDVSKFTNLVLLSLVSNNLTTIDVSSAKKLKALYLSNNKLTSVTLDNPVLWNLYLDINKLTSVSLDKLPMLEQLWLNNNQLTEVNVDKNPELSTLNVVGNKLKFSTMPPSNLKRRVGLRDELRFKKYSYNLQAPIDVECVDGKVDLSSEAVAGGQPTTFRWFVGNVQVVNGELTGEELTVDEDYTVVNGVSTLKLDNTVEKLVCTMTNPAFPNAVLATNYVTFTPATGIEKVVSGKDVQVQFVNGGIVIVGGENSPVAVYSVDGKLVYQAKAANDETHVSLVHGTYIVRVGNKAAKISVR